jgi:hypothetical protein
VIGRKVLELNNANKRDREGQKGEREKGKKKKGRLQLIRTDTSSNVWLEKPKVDLRFCFFNNVYVCMYSVCTSRVSIKYTPM